MESKPSSTHPSDELLPILEELRRREPIFHTAEFGSSIADYDRNMAPDYWEVGASGKQYSREFILRSLDGKSPAYADALGWETWDHAVRPLGSNTYLMTYVLKQGTRITRRATIWQKGTDGWSILYHQGTLVSTDNDGTTPPAP
jgi:hypothetical protein